MRKKISLLTSAVMLLASLTACGSFKQGSSVPNNVPIFTAGTEDMNGTPDTETETAETETEPPHISPVETFTSHDSVQWTVSSKIKREKGSNTIQFPLSNMIKEGDKVESFTFIVYSGDDNDIGQFKGGFGISLTDGCPAATDECWYQSGEIITGTEGTYGEITFDVPQDAVDYIDPNGKIEFGYYWGGATSLEIESVTCNFERTRDIPCDGTTTEQVGKSVSHFGANNVLSIPADFLPSDVTLQAATFEISSGGPLKEFIYALGYKSSLGEYFTFKKAIFTDSSSLTLSWIVDEEAKNLMSGDGELMLGFWWSDQPDITVDSVTVKYSEGVNSQNTEVKKEEKDEKNDKTEEVKNETGFRKASEIVKDINVGWNLGNSLDSHSSEKKGLATETGWGNIKTTPEIVKCVKDAGFNAIRIPVTWGEHMDGNTIQSEWLDRVQEVVNYAYNNDMYVIMNVHHDDALWLKPNEASYKAASEKLCAIWKQVAERFADYGDRLIFEGMNETRTIGSELEWMGGTPEERAVVNRYFQDFVDTVRATGGKNADRTLIVAPYGACAEEAALNDVVVPRGKNIVLNVHYYAPWKFSDGQSKVFDDAGKSELDAKFALLKSKFGDNGIPVLIDEFGCQAAASDDVRAGYYSYYISRAKLNGIKCFVWDNGQKTGNSSFGLLNRGNLTWNDTILKGIMEGAK